VSDAIPSFSHDSDHLARDYDEVSAERQLPSGQQLVRRLAIAAGERVLDVGCGTGRLAEHIADIVGPTGSVLGVDPLPARIGLAHRRARANLSFEVGNANDLSSLADASVDVVVLNAVFHWLADKRRPLREFARVLRRRGDLGLTTRPPGERTLLEQVRAEVLAEPPLDALGAVAERSLFGIGPEQLRTLLLGAGFVDVRIEVRATENTFADAETVIRYSEASSFGNFLGHLPLDLRDRAREEIRRRIDRLSAGQPIVRRGRRMVAIAMRG
jgi:arsenite methyltransferase